MTNTHIDHQLITRVEQFYYREARLLDERCFQQWLALVDEGIEYSIPTRYVPQPDPKLQDTEAFLAVDRELERADGGQGSPMRHDHYLETLVRTIRPFKTNAWSESPAPRTRRFITNVEVEMSDNDDSETNEYKVFSNFQLFYSQSGDDNHTYYGGRRDVLREVDGQFKLLKREIITDWDIITAPTMALIF